MLARALPFSPDQDESFFQEIPATAAVFILRGQGEPYVSKTANLRRRLQRLLGTPAEQSKRLNLRDRVQEIEFTPAGSDFESQFLLYRVLRETFPETYAARLRLRPAPLVKLHLENEYPRASVTTRLGRLSGGTPGAKARSHAGSLTARLEAVPFQSSCTTNLYYGPFSSRAAAEKFASDALDFFKMRRCVEDLHPDPSFPGCVYSEMKMCLAPCFKGCTDDEYHAEVARVQAFFETRGESLTRELGEQRDRASTELAFEEAAAMHAKLDKLKSLLSQLPEVVRRIDELKALMIQPSAGPGCVSLFLFRDCALHGPVNFNVESRAESRSMEARLEEALAQVPVVEIRSTAERMEHLAMLKRWYYRSTRVGEIFLADTKGVWPLRRIVRGIGRVYKGEKPQETVTFSATQIPPAPP